ncbi:hypothetical protein evm_010180 [Chilo suppressalis]|nr:hypothetical protein evm_010180 [Chilo suppressalis]
MDIRNFFEKGTTREKRNKSRDSSSGGSDENDNHDKTHVMPRSLHANIGQASHSPAEPVNISVADYSFPSTSQQTYDVIVDPEIIVDDGYYENDLGRYVGLATQLSTEKKRELLQHPWIPPRNYDFESDVSHLKRSFNNAWLDQYAPWLVYSKRLKGALCKHCVLFPPPISTVRGILG